MQQNAKEALTSLEITQAQIKARGLKADVHTIVLMQKLVGACLTAEQDKGLVRSIPKAGPYKAWELVR